MIRGMLAIVAGLQLTLACAQAQPPPAVPGQDWWVSAPVYRSKYYSIKTDLPTEDARVLADHLDATFESYMELVSKLPVRLRRPARLEVYLFARQHDYQNVLRLRFQDDGTGSWGKCISRGNTISLVGWRGQFSTEEMKPLLQHEGFHQVARHFFPGLPTWADEGLAELFERGVMVDNQLVLGEFPQRDKQRLLEAVANNTIVPLEQFFAIDGAQWNRRVRVGEVNTTYLQAWSIVHFLVFAEDGKYETGFLKFLVNLNRGADWRRSFLAAFGMPGFRDIQAKWLAHVRATPPTDYRTTIRRLEFLAAGMAKLREQEVYPATLGELRNHLERVQFSHKSVLFGAVEQLSGLDPQTYEVPFAAGGAKREFLLVDVSPASGQRSSLREPPPMSIVVRGMGPQALAATWQRRDRKWQYSIVSGPAAGRVVQAAESRAARVRKPRDTAADANDPPEVAKDVETKSMPRKWVSADGNFSTQATLIEFADGYVYLKRSDGRQAKVSYELLSRADQEYVDQYKGGQ